MGWTGQLSDPAGTGDSEALPSWHPLPPAHGIGVKRGDIDQPGPYLGKGNKPHGNVAAAEDGHALFFERYIHLVHL